jgi:hypothetical protein
VVRPQLAPARFVAGGAPEHEQARSVGTAALNDYESADVGSALVSSRSSSSYARSSKKVKAGDPVQSFFQKVRGRQTVHGAVLLESRSENSPGEEGERREGRPCMMQARNNHTFALTAVCMSACTLTHPHTCSIAPTQVRLAWNIFFPEQAQVISPKEEVKKRLRMVLVADRCGMNPASLSEMKKHIVKALAVSICMERQSCRPGSPGPDSAWGST